MGCQEGRFMDTFYKLLLPLSAHVTHDIIFHIALLMAIWKSVPEVNILVSAVKVYYVVSTDTLVSTDSMSIVSFIHGY